MNKTRLYWLCQIGGWSLYALFQIFFIYLADLYNSEYNLLDNKLIISHVLLVVLSILTSHFYREFIIRWGWLKKFTRELIPKIILASLFLGTVTVAYMVTVSGILGNLIPERDLSLLYLLGNLFGFTILYLIWSLIYFMYHYVESYNKSLRYEAYINEIRLNKLKSQLNPHFIFNGLNSIRALVDEDPGKSKVAITQLSNILRNSLIMDKQKLINFSDEIKTVKDYLDLESIRFEERLKTELMIDPESNQFKVPPLMIQTLVENGIKHGISNLVSGGEIQIHTEVEQDMLHIRIRNSGQYINGKPKDREGYGLENTRQRLKLIFEDQADFSIKNENEETVLTEITIPRAI